MRRSSETPALSIAEELVGRGHVHWGDEAVQVRRIKVFRLKYDSHSRWTFELTAEDQSAHDPFGPVLRTHARPPSFLGTTDLGEPLRIPSLDWEHAENDALVGTAQEVFVGPQKITFMPDRQVVVAELTPTELAVPEKHVWTSYTGEMREPEGSKPRPAMEIPSGLGKMRLVLHYRFETADVGAQRSLLRIPTPTIALQVGTNSLSQDHDSLITRFLGELELALRLVSYLSRRHVYWSRIKVSSYDENSRATLERVRGGIGDPIDVDRERQFVNPYRLGSNLANMVDGLRASPYKDALLLAMLYLVSAINARFVETSLLEAFTAWETLTNGIGAADGEEWILDPPVFKELRARMKNVLSQFIADHTLPLTVSSAVASKMSELNRPSFAQRASNLLERENVGWQDLWKTSTSLIARVRELADRRNQFVHAGKIDNPTLTSIDARRAIVLVERLIYRLIAGDDQWLDPRAYDFVRGLSKLEDAVRAEQASVSSQAIDT